jgi:hypothetical protein
MSITNKELIKLKKEIMQKLEEITQLKDSSKKNKNEDIKQMIKYYRNMIIEVEDRRTRLNNFNLQTLAVSVVAFVWIISNCQKFDDLQLGNIFYIFTLLIIGELALTSIISILYFSFQSAFKYPFLKLKEFGNKWKWFYLGNEEILRINANPFSKKHWKNSLKPYLRGLSIFLNNYEKEDLNKEITDNIQQLYLLQVYNYYKNQFYFQLNKIWKYSLYIIILLFIILIIVVIFYYVPQFYRLFFHLK